MTDFHAHILPSLDDGAESLEESIRLLLSSASQEVTSLMATPHFYAEEQSPQQFLERRNRSWAQLRPFLQASMPEILLGAEVRYYEGICMTADLGLLKIENSDLLLLEMPFSRWSKRMLQDILELSSRSDMTILLAHIERYLEFMPSDAWEILLAHNVRIQANADFFCRRLTQRKALNMLRAGKIHVLGSDCHNMRSRPPTIGKAVQIISAHLGYEAIRQMEHLSQELLCAEEVLIP